MTTQKSISWLCLSERHFFRHGIKSWNNWTSGCIHSWLIVWIWENDFWYISPRRYQLMILNKLTLRYYAPELMNFQLAIFGDRFSQFFIQLYCCFVANLNRSLVYVERVETFSNSTNRNDTKVRWVNCHWQKLKCDLESWSFRLNSICACKQNWQVI